MRPRHVACLTAALLTAQGSAAAGAWAQEAGHGFAINQTGYGFAAGREKRMLFDGYGEAGLGHGLTAVFSFDSDLSPEISQYVWRAGAGLRASTTIDLVPEWVFSIEATLRYQGHESVIVDPVFAGDGVGYGGRIDAGRSFELFDVKGFANISLGYIHRSMAPAELKLEAVAGIDLDRSFQAGIGYFGSIASGPFYEPGAYEKHEIQAYLRWRIDADYAIAASLAQTVHVDRTPEETTIRLALWTFFYPDPSDNE